ncbi:MAG: sigma-54-dependent Fis family transcriptional regulator [Gammaproteobacteria bacterium]|nr:sigma-54-dependent Fis family transcriptional regulator [Gammaproteobacteria bacterium]
MSSPQILVVDDESDIRSLLQEILVDEGYEVAVAEDAAAARRSRKSTAPDLVLLDIWMPDTDGITLLREWAKDGLKFPVVMMSGHGTVDTAVEATRLGAFDFIEKPLSMAKLLRTVERALEQGRHEKIDKATRLVPQLVEPVGKSKVMKDLRERVRLAAQHDASVLMVGEAGTGREAFARYLHSESPRSGGPFIDVICSALTDENSEELLLGSERGGETHAGFIEQARGGVLFLNEIGDLGARAQQTLLGALEQDGFIRVGGRDVVPHDAMFISAAQPGFERQGDGFRQDLLDHLSVVQIRIPSLREYSEDVPDLLRYYVDVLVDHSGAPFRRFSVAAQNRLRNYPWPGNMRNLKNMVHRLLIEGKDETISLEEVEAALVTQPAEEGTLVKQDLLALPLREAREQFERAYLTQQLALCDGKVGKLAERVGMERTHLYRKLKSLKVEFGRD